MTRTVIIERVELGQGARTFRVLDAATLDVLDNGFDSWASASAAAERRGFAVDVRGERRVDAPSAAALAASR